MYIIIVAITKRDITTATIHHTIAFDTPNLIYSSVSIVYEPSEGAILVVVFYSFDYIKDFKPFLEDCLLSFDLLSDLSRLS